MGEIQMPIGRLHVLTDETLQSRWSHLDLALAAAKGGADVVQYREKRPTSTAAMVATARALRRELPSTVHLLVNDRVDVAIAVGAEGAHLGRLDLPIAAARGLVGDTGILGGTANGLAEARECFGKPLNYLGVGPVFGTRSKSDAAPALGLEALARIVSECPLPVIAIGGITAETVPALFEAGVWGVAVLSAVACSEDPAAAVARLRGAIDSTRSRRHVET